MNENLDKKTLWCYSTSCAGRDLTYTLMSLFFITFILYTGGLDTKQYSVLTIIIIVCRIWDAINDPMMSTIITNTRTKRGRYTPWILIGAIANAIFLVGLFLSPGLKGWPYVIYLGVCYLLWGMTYTMNDVSYWSLIPHLARSKNMRDKITGLVAIFASVGQFLTGGLIPILTTGNMVSAYRIYAIVVAIIFVISQVMVFFTVKDTNGEEETHQKNIKFKEMFKIIFHNDQLLVMTISFFIYSFASVLLTTFGTNFFYFKLGYDGSNITIFTVVFALGTLGAQIAFGSLIKKYTRKELLKVSTIIMLISYFVFFIICNLKVSLFGSSMVYLLVLCIVGLIIFASQGLHYLIVLIMLTNTIEYDEWKNGKRNETIVFSVRPFMVKLSSAFEQGALSLVLLVSGLFSITSSLSDLEELKAKDQSLDITAAANELLSKATDSQILALTMGMCIIPIVMFIIEYLIIKKKYIIDENMYEKMLNDINSRKEKVVA